uniref:Fibronectin type III domain-containing protein n=1 Tax=Roseihalotalea indica TaxID=2867963 RepID=A0AA49GUF4_9BACT|nr:fibronectin type III domain-containing protein [Tunicatimonas sp. TK19036]
MRQLFTCFIFLWSVNYTASAQEMLFAEDFEAAPASAWTPLPGKDHGVVEIITTGAPSKNHVARLGRSTDGPFTTNRLDLSLDLALYSQVALQFDLYHYYEETDPQDGIYLSVDSGRYFVKIYSFSFEQWAPKTTGTIPPLNLNVLAAAQGLKLSKNTIIRFQQYGNKDFNGGAEFSDGIQLDNIRLFVPNNIYARLPFQETFEGETWSSAISVGNTQTSDPTYAPSPFGVVEIIPFDEQQGRVVRMGSQFDNLYTTNALDLHLDLSSQANVELSFKVLNNLDETHPQDGIYFSHDAGKHFVKVFDFDFENWRQRKFGAYPPININRLARQHRLPLTANFVIRFQQHDDSDFEGSRLTSDGIYLDDIVVQEVHQTYAAYPFTEDFEADSLASYWKHGLPNLLDTAFAITPTGTVEFVSTPNNGQAIRLGNTVDRLYTTNALDLYVDLSQAKNPELSFQILDHYDETHPQDGVYFSNDAGEHFVKVVDFDGDNWADNIWGNFHALDLREISAQHRLSLTNQFVIRFQQHDDDDFEGTRTISDGIYLDQITIQEPQCEYYATFPFVETFETDSLAKYWRTGNLSKTIDTHYIRPGGSALIIDTLSYSEKRALALGRFSDGQLTASALDLHVDLSYQSDLELNFWMYNHEAELKRENGIWVSNNGGKSFKQAYIFSPTAQQQYAHYQINLDSLMEALAIEYTNQFIIRFQQMGDRSFLGQGSFSSGAFLDNVVLTHRINSPNVQDIRINHYEEEQQQDLYWPPTESATLYHTQLFLEQLSSHHLISADTSSENFATIPYGKLKPGQLYYFRLKSANNITQSSWSRPIMISTDQQGRISTVSIDEEPTPLGLRGE